MWGRTSVVEVLSVLAGRVSASTKLASTDYSAIPREQRDVWPPVARPSPARRPPVALCEGQVLPVLERPGQVFQGGVPNEAAQWCRLAWNSAAMLA